MKTVSNPGKKILIIAILCIYTLVAKAQEDTDTVAVKKSIECVEAFYSVLQQAVKGNTSGLEFENEIKKYVDVRNNKHGIDMPSDIPYIYYGYDRYTNPDIWTYTSVVENMAEKASDFDITFNVLTAKELTGNIISVLVSKVVVYKGSRYDYIDWVEVKHLDGDPEKRCSIQIVMETSTVRIVGNDGEPLTSADVNGKTIIKLPNSCGVSVIGMKDTSRKLTITDPYYSDTVQITIKRGEEREVQLKKKKETIVPAEKAQTRLSVPFYIVPGLGQIEFGEKTEGFVTIIGESMLLGGGIISHISAKNQLEIMQDIDVSLDGYLSAKSSYTTLRVINVTCYVAAAALYGFHLYRVYQLSKQSKSREYAFLTPTIIVTNELKTYGLCFSLNF